MKSVEALSSHHTNAFIGAFDVDPDHSGVTVAVKDIIDVAGAPTTAGAPPREQPLATADAEVVANLRTGGATIVGKTNMFEWAYGVDSANRTFGAVDNPAAPGHSAGGSSGGSAAAVAAHLCDWSVGTDTAGSIRIPAALCGVVGIKPTPGLVSTAGVLPLSPSQDAVGCFARSVAEARACLTAMLGAAELPGERSAAEPPRLAIPRGWVSDLDEEVGAAWREFAAQLPEIDLGPRDKLFDAAVTLQRHEAWTVHAEMLESRPDRYSEVVRERVLAGAAVGGEEARAAAAVLGRRADALDAALEAVTAVVLPTTACVAPRLDGPDRREQHTRFTRPFNGTGHPAISIPLPVDGLPVGLQLVGRRGEDGRLATTAALVERALAEGIPMRRPDA
jgi:Asp-tRNA(Asn)/Glu-tRNA(Gln) amidotransferase A subunit family amidase